MNLQLVVSPDQISDAELAQLKIIDLRPAQEFEQGHLPGAIHLDGGVLNRAEGEVRGLLPDADHVNKMARNLGLQPGDHVLAYDHGVGTSAARLIWVLHAYGFMSVSWLNGGFDGWLGQARAISTELVDVEASDINLQFAGGNILDIDQLSSSLSDADLRVVDVRSAAEFVGSDVRAARGGHVPNAKHTEWTDAFNSEGYLKSDDELRALFSNLDVNDNNHVVVYCQTHQRSSLTYVVLKHLQYDRVSAIDGAWSAWGNSTQTPIES